MAGLAGVAGVVGLSSAATGGGGGADPAGAVPALTAPGTATAPSLRERLAEVRRAARAADRALARTVPRSGGSVAQGPGPRLLATAATIPDDHG
ncbi:MAG TPA: hypothetical protein VL422_05780, partial [Miltoncostaea sp.]|nr:hypothetical protein [Miltoncostaea sp.]